MPILRWLDSASIMSACCSRWWLVLIWGGLLALAACGAPEAEVQQLQKDVKALQAEVAELKDELSQLQAAQEKMLAWLAKQPSPEAKPPAPPEPEITVGQLLKEKERYLGNRVTVKGRLGPVLIHRQAFILKGPDGEIPVSFADLGDQAAIRRLISRKQPGEIVVIGVLSASGQVGDGYQIAAEAIEFL